jgi:hypothetical protein
MAVAQISLLYILTGPAHGPLATVAVTVDNFEIETDRCGRHLHAVGIYQSLPVAELPGFSSFESGFYISRGPGHGPSR